MVNLGFLYTWAWRIRGSTSVKMQMIRATCGAMLRVAKAHTPPYRVNRALGRQLQTGRMATKWYRSITLWAHLSEALIKTVTNMQVWRKNNTVLPLPSHVITHYRYVCVTERYTYMETLHMKKTADLVAAYKFITLLTFELSSFRETAF